MQHVRVGDEQPGLLAETGSLGGRGVAVIRRGEQRGDGRALGREVMPPGVQLVELVMAQRLGGKEIEGAGVVVAQQRVQHGQVIAERLAAGRGRDDGHRVARARTGDGLGLMRVELCDAAAGERRLEAGMQVSRDGSHDRGLSRERAPGRHVGHKAVVPAQFPQQLFERHREKSHAKSPRTQRQK